MFGEWPAEHPLPLPEWGERSAPVLRIPDGRSFRRLEEDVEAALGKVLATNNYNTIGNYIALYKGFKASKCLNLFDYFQMYTPPITPAHHTCVGLALELWRNIAKNEPAMGEYFYLVSCEESIGAFEEYAGLQKEINETKNILEKEHVLLAMRFDLGGRDGIMLCDPGYHVGRAIIAMKDELAPHTGWFIQSKEPHLEKQFNYEYSKTNDDFVQWSERVTRNKAMVEEVHSLVYIRKPYLTAVDVTERRNLVYSFRSLLSRDRSGTLIAGIFFKVTEHNDEFLLFYQDEGKKRIKLNFSEFANLHHINEQIKPIIEKCNDQLNFAPGQLLSTLYVLYGIANDKRYVQQLLDINTCINDISED